MREKLCENLLNQATDMFNVTCISESVSGRTAFVCVSMRQRQVHSFATWQNPTSTYVCNDS